MTNERLRSHPHALPAAAVLLGAALGCDASVGALEHRYESASICPLNWQIRLEDDLAIGSDIVEQNGTLYANLSSPSGLSGLMAIPESGGDPIVLGPALSGFQFWAESDRLIYSDFGDRTDNWAAKFRSVSLNGGEPELLLDAATGRTDAQPLGIATITPTDFWWTEYLDGPTTVWRASRTDLVPTKIGTVSAAYPSTSSSTPEPTTFVDMVPTSDGVVLSTDLVYVASFLPFDGSPVRTLSGLTGFAEWVGTDAAGAYWSRQRPGAAAERDAYDVVITPADGGPARSYWNDMPDHVLVDQMVHTKDGGWLIYAGETFDDKQDHGTVWTLDATGSARRLACSPPNEEYIDVGRPVEAPDAFYFIVAENHSKKTRVIRVAR